MLELPQVTCVLGNGQGDPRTGKLLRYLARHVHFGELFLLSPQDAGNNAIWLPMPELTYNEWSCFGSRALGEIGSLPNAPAQWSWNSHAQPLR